jgi:predicted permease
LTGADALGLFYSSLAVSLPTFGWVIFGLLLYRFGVLSESLNAILSRLSFNFGLPLMLFAGAAQVDYATLRDANYLMAGVLATLLTLGLAWVYSGWRGHPRASQGIFVQACFRSNLAIVGVALTFSAYGERGPALAALPIAVMTILYNVLAVWVLGATLGASTRLGTVLLGIVRNPLIIGISAGIVVSLFELPFPFELSPLSAGLSAFFLPLMLVCIGGSLTLSRLYRAGVISWEASVWRLCISPLLCVMLALGMGVRGEELGVLFLLIASPVAASSYVMVVAARGDGILAANMVVLTTLWSVLTITVGFFLLSLFSLVG